MPKLKCGECNFENEDTEHWCRDCGAFLARTGQVTSSPSAYQGAVAPGPDPGATGPSLGVDLDLPANALRCPVCGTANEPTRYYCRQGGHELRIYREPTAEDPGEGSWWSRLIAKIKGDGNKGAVDRAKQARRKLRGMSRYTRNFRTGLAGGVVALLVVGIAPGPRRYVQRAIKDITFPDRHSFVDVDAVDPLDGQFATLQWDPTFIADNSRTTAWGAEWPGGGVEATPPGGGCIQVTTDPGIVVQFLKSSDIDRVRVWAGTWEDDPAQKQRARPKILELRDTSASPAACHYVELDDVVEEQTVEVKNINDVEQLEVRIVAVWSGTDDENDLVAVSEIWFEKSR